MAYAGDRPNLSITLRHLPCEFSVAMRTLSASKLQKTITMEVSCMKLLLSLMLTLIVCAYIPTSPVFADDAKDLQRANEMNTQVMQLYKVGKYDQAIEKGNESLAIRERVLGPEHPD